MSDLPPLTANICQSFTKQLFPSCARYHCQQEKGTYFDVYSFVPSKGRNCWHLSDDMGEEFRQSHTAYLKQNYSQLANPPLEKQSILMKQCFKIQNLEARAEFLRFYT